MARFRDDRGEPATLTRLPDRGPPDPEIRRAWEMLLPTDLDDQLTARLDRLRPDVEAAFGLRLGACEGWSALRYPPGAFYRPHRDRDPLAAGDPASRRAVSVVVFVNDPGDAAAPFDGGALRFYGLIEDRRAGGVGLDLTPEAGTLVAFLASQVHEVTQVDSGERYSLVTWLADAD
jgi:predicted 2-oxoglutarate/Fe(II)-dependent dioxygenase YbiX